MDLKNPKTTNGVGNNSALFSEALADGALGHAVKFVARLSMLVRDAEYCLAQAITGRNIVTRTNAVTKASAFIHRCTKETADWHSVIETMKQGKDVHLQENCKGSKLEIVGGSEHEFGQYLINQSSPKFCKKNTEGKDYIQKVDGNGSN